MATTAAVPDRDVPLLRVLMGERRLTREQTVDLLQRRAIQMGIRDFALSVRQLDRWLAGEVGDPRATRIRVVEAEFGHKVDQLLSPTRQARTLPSLTNPPQRGSLAHFETIVANLAEIDHEAGASSSLAPAMAVSESLIVIAGQLSGPDRDSCLRIAARCSELAGWFHQDSGSPVDAHRWTGRAVDLAQASQADDLLPYLLMRRSAVAAELELAEEALLLAEAAARRAEPGTQRALAYRELATAHALRGDNSALRRAVDLALNDVEVNQDNDLLAPYCSLPYIQSEAAAAALLAGDSQLALTYLEPAARNWPQFQRRDKAVCLARLAYTYAHLGHLDQAETWTIETIRAARGCGSTRVVRLLHKAVSAIAEGGSHARAAALNDILSSLP